MERARSEASKHSTDSGRSTKVERPERSKSKEDEDRLSSKESTSSAKRMTNFRKQISRLSSKTAMMSEEPGKQFVPTLRGYLDFLYREAEQKLMWKRLDAATVRLSTIQEGQDARRPVVALTTRNSISQMKTARTAAFEGFEEEGASGHLRRHSQSSLDSRVRRQSAVVIDLNFKTPHLEEGEEGDDEGKGDRHTSGSAKEHPLKEPLTAKKVNIAQVREILKHLDDLPKWLEAPLVTSGTGAVPKPLVVAVADNNPDLVGLLIEFRADFTMPYEGESNYKGWIKPGQSLLSSVSNRKGRFIGTMLADRLAQIEEMLTVQTEEEEFVDLDALEVSSSKSAFGAIAATWGTDELKPRHTRGHPKGFYEVLEHLDEGDTSTVWGGIHLETKVPVAIKIEVKSDEIEMWEEIDIMRRLRHPNISRLFETFESETQVFMVLELCHGRLYDSLAEGDSYTVCRSPRLLRQLVLAVACLHEHKISHRDVQLENFLLLKPDGPLEEAIPKLIDFTTAKDFSGGQVLVTKVCTPTYVAKEILSRKMEPYTEKVDVWSLGVVFFIMFCGHPPFVGDTDFEILTKVKKGTWSFQPSPAWTAAPKQGMELIQRMITPVAERFSAQDVLRHEFLAESGRG